MGLETEVGWLHSFFTLSPEMMAILTEDGRFLDVNPACEKLLGYSPGEFQGTFFLDLIHEADRVHAQLQMERLLKGEGPVSFESRCRHKDVSLRHIQWVCHRSPVEKIFYLVSRDLTRSKQLETDLFESREWFHKLAEASKDGIAVTERGKMLMVNHALARMLGWEAPEMIGRNAMEFTAPEFRETILNNIVEESEKTYEVMGLRRDGTRFPAEISPRMALYQGRKVRVSFFRDITERKKIEEEVRRQKDFIQNLVNSSIDGLMAFDKEYRYTLWNPAMERLTGHSREEVLGQCAFDVFPFLKQIGQDRYFREALEGKTAVMKERPYRTPAGREGYFESVYSPLRDLSGRIIGGLGVIHEITERKMIEQELKQSELNLRAVFDNTFQNITLMDREGRVLAFNQNVAASVRENLGQELKIGRLMDDFVDPENAKTFRKKFQRALRGEAVQFQQLYRSKDGTPHWLEIAYNPVFGDHGEIEGVCLASSNIDERKRAEESLRKSETTLRALFNSQTHNIILIDKDGRILAFNEGTARAAREVQGVEYRVGQDFLAPLPEKSREIVRERHQRVLRGESIRMETSFRGVDGVVHWYDLQYDPVRDEKGEVTAICLTNINIDSRKKAEEDLRRSEADLKAVFNSAPQVTVLIGKDGRIKGFNLMAETMAPRVLGRSLEVGMPFVETPPAGASRELYEKSFQAALEGEGTNGERPIRSADGQPRWVEVNYQPVLSDGGGIEGVCFTLRFIDERKKAEEVLRSSEESHRRLVEESPIAMCVYAGDGKILFANPEAARLFKAERAEDLRGKDALDFLLPGNIGIVKERIRKAVEEGIKSEPRVTQLVRLDGWLIDVEVTGIPLGFQGQKAVLGIFKEIIPPKNA